MSNSKFRLIGLVFVACLVAIEIGWVVIPDAYRTPLMGDPDATSDSDSDQGVAGSYRWNSIYREGTQHYWIENSRDEQLWLTLTDGVLQDDPRFGRRSLFFDGLPELAGDTLYLVVGNQHFTFNFESESSSASVLLGAEELVFDNFLHALNDTTSGVFCAEFPDDDYRTCFSTRNHPQVSDFQLSAISTQPEVQTENSDRAETTTTIPAAYHGDWGSSRENCQSLDDIGPMTITSTGMDHYEFSGQVVSYEQYNENTIDITLRVLSVQFEQEGSIIIDRWTSGNDSITFETIHPEGMRGEPNVFIRC